MRSTVFVLFALVGCALVAACDHSNKSQPLPSSGGAGGGGTGGTRTGGAITGGTVGASGGALGDAGLRDVVDQTSRDSRDAESSAGDLGRDGLLACLGTSITVTNGCHTASDCKNMPGAKCCTSSPCWPSSITPIMCGIPPSMCKTFGAATGNCTLDADCQASAGGKCIKSISGCPQCESRNCQYPPPPCTKSPDSCGTGNVCQDNGSCALRLCSDGFACPPEMPCKVGAPAADGHGCQPMPCNQGWVCGSNERCTTPGNPVNHGCTPLTCKTDQECDCGFCVEGQCRTNLGMCSSPPV